MALLFFNGITTTLNGTISDSDTAITVNSIVLPDLGAENYTYMTIVSDNGTEYVKVTNVSGASWTIERGFDGSTAVSHASGSRVEGRIISAILEELKRSGVSAAQWGYLGAMDQGVASSDNPTFDGLSLTGIADAGGQRVISVGTPVQDTDAATKGFVENLVTTSLSWQHPVKDVDLSTPPGTPTSGDRYLVATGATGAWSGHDGEVAGWDGSVWNFTAPFEGMTVWEVDNSRYWTYNGTDWVRIGLTIDHNLTAGLQGGGTDEKYHLTANQHTNVSSVSDTQWGYVSNTDQGIASGDSPTFYGVTLTGGSTARLTITGSSQASIKYRDSSGAVDEKIISFLNEGGVSKWRLEKDAGGLTHDNILVMQHSDGFIGMGSSDPKSRLHVVGLPEYADNAAAITGGLTAGAFYRTGDLLKVVH
ncbi:DUF2793 domain-containing protein [Magnetococcales bacterium HHB-1]